MARVYLGLGSNIEREHYLAAGLDALTAEYGELALSSVYNSAAIGFDGQPFLNMVVGFEAALEVAELARGLRRIEVAHGRPPNAARFSARQLDIDILTYGDLVAQVNSVVLPRPEILHNAFVLRPLAELAPEARHPQTGNTYAAHWQAYDQSSQAVTRVDFSWHGQQISKAE
ncbi:2-amino-4-hydroxy-6-hydroxymethyldihydropteridine diphosphokinase [Parahaliea sp. F7430]|uniref:2-amino-4-hydroxy-6-hydroxymethyldihydropteridine diphosphokinase n=1 Tax=Sediminihaliea albiluteola TaxID=2758564 RepID=A0A7W2YJY1_9GAMM|nr:2-amino-4-hydroxy-6-hydroxymethyldihydropteridine diphosphokinase [Sediminihaliea albiluteola]MBA6414051.1 2-amino-4-hydroxy-6-hydroxymethyldihydropteridine diphosphokinase [Sediminihaliea albiluteola]